MSCLIIVPCELKSTSRLYCSWLQTFTLNAGKTFKHGCSEERKKNLFEKRYLLGAALAATALPPMPQTVTTASILVGLNIFFRPAWVSQCPAQLPLLFSESGCWGGRWWGGIPRGERRVQQSVLFNCFWPLFKAIGFLNDSFQNKEGVLCLSCLLDNTFYHFLLVAHGSGEIKLWQFFSWKRHK